MRSVPPTDLLNYLQQLSGCHIFYCVRGMLQCWQRHLPWTTVSTLYCYHPHLHSMSHSLLIFKALSTDNFVVILPIKSLYWCYLDESLVPHNQLEASKNQNHTLGLLDLLRRGCFKALLQPSISPLTDVTLAIATHQFAYVHLLPLLSNIYSQHYIQTFSIAFNITCWWAAAPVD